MTTLHQLPLSAFEVYEPTASEKAKGRWAVVYEKWLTSEEPDWNSTAHVIPTFGQLHRIAKDCWCEPRTTDDGTIVHEASQ